MQPIRQTSIKQYIKQYPATSTIILVLMLLHVLTYIYGNGATDFETARNFGALYSSNKNWEEFPYLLTSLYQHIGGLLHIFSNILALILIGPFIERVFGTFKYVLLYNFSGIFGSMLILVFESNVYASGASSSIYGLLGLYITLIVKKHPAISKVDALSIVGLVVYNVIFTLFIPGISITGHLGGLFGGMILGMIFSAPRKYLRENVFASIFKTVLISVLLFIILQIPQSTLKGTSFIDVTTSIGIGEYVTGEKTLWIINLNKDKKITEFNWIIEEFNEKIVPTYNELIFSYNEALKLEDRNEQIKSIDHLYNNTRDYLQNARVHEGIEETSKLQAQLIKVYKGLKDATSIAVTTLETVNASNGEELISIIVSVEEDITLLSDMIEEYRNEYGK